MALNRKPAGDKRRWERRQVDVPIRVVAGDMTEAAVIPGRGTKLSAGGICLFALANLAIGAQIDVEIIDFHSGTRVRVSGIVRNRAAYLYGVEFVVDQQEDRQQIARPGDGFGKTPHCGVSDVTDFWFEEAPPYQRTISIWQK
jgi:PilZ domain-containing protein